LPAVDGHVAHAPRDLEADGALIVLNQALQTGRDAGGRSTTNGSRGCEKADGAGRSDHPWLSWLRAVGARQRILYHSYDNSGVDDRQPGTASPSGVVGGTNGWD